MLYYILATIFFATLSVILSYNLLLALFKKGIELLFLQKLSLSVLITTLVTSAIALAYSVKLRGGISFAYPEQFEGIHTFLSDGYPFFLFIVPTLSIALLFSLPHHRKAAVTLTSLSFFGELFVLISTLLI